MTEPLADDSAVAARVQAAFERVARERMAGLPFVNEALRVEMVGLRRWHGLWLGVLVTPWFMNLLLLPGDGAADGPEVAAKWPSVPFGDSVQFAFPAGVLSFLAGREGEAGEYLACSLFSPMFEFADHATARQTAEACLGALFDPATAAPPAAAAPPPVSKRDFLRGRWHGEDTAPAKEH
jgi:[NiFe] hydrogenase assembly HybE family chaperone